MPRVKSQPMRTFDPAVPNRVANIPEVARALCLGGEEMSFDFSQAIADPQNVFLADGGGVSMFIWSAPRVFEWHLVFAPGFRGRVAIDATERMRDAMLSDYADMLWARPPVSNRAVRWLARHIGMKSEGFAVHPLIGDVEYLTCHRS